MNWIRADLKAEARAALSKGYWRTVLVALILMMVAGSGVSVGNAPSSVSTVYNSGSSYEIHSSSGSDFDLDLDFLDNLSAEEVAGIIAMISGIIVIALIISIALNLFLFGPLTVGCARYTELAIKRPADFNLGRGFSPNYWNVVKSMFIRTLFTALWALLYAVVYLILTGIVVGVMIASDASGGVIVFLMFLLFLIGLAGGFLLALKLYEYRMIPYILASDPNMARRDVFRISKEMVKGERLNILVLDLSFIGWILLAVLTCGIWMIVYVNPYKMLTEGALFHKLCEKVGFRVDMNGQFLAPAGGNMGGGNGGYYNENMYNGGYNNGGYNNGGYNNGGYNNGGYNNGDFNKDGYGSGGYNNGSNNGYENGGYLTGGNNNGYGTGGNGGYNNNSYGTGDYNDGSYNNNGYGAGGSGYNDGSYNNNGYGAGGNGGYNDGSYNNNSYGTGGSTGSGNNNNGYGSSYSNSDSYGSSYNNSSGYNNDGSSYNDNGSGYSNSGSGELEYKGSGSRENGPQNTGSSYEEYDYTVGYGHPSTGHDHDPKKDQDVDNIDFT
ncbi:MAG: DUF975 family protein [Eubacteriales bacterium]